MTFNHVLLEHLGVLQDSRNRQNAQIAHVRKILLHTYFFAVCCKNSDYLGNRKFTVVSLKVEQFFYHCSKDFILNLFSVSTIFSCILVKERPNA